MAVVPELELERASCLSLSSMAVNTVLVSRFAKAVGVLLHADYSRVSYRIRDQIQNFIQLKNTSAT